MSVQLKPLSMQVFFITGATSKAGKATVKMALENGAKVFMVSRAETMLESMQEEFRHTDRNTAYAVAEMSDINQVRYALDRCLKTFGTIDSWVNHMEEDFYHQFENQSFKETKKLFKLGLLDIYNASRVAFEYLRGAGGALINAGFLNFHLNPRYTGLFNQFNAELERYNESLLHKIQNDHLPISVSLILPFALKVQMNRYIPLFYPEEVANMVMKCAEFNLPLLPVRDLKSKMKLNLTLYRKPISLVAKTFVSAGVLLFYLKRKRLI